MSKCEMPEPPTSPKEQEGTISISAVSPKEQEGTLSISGYLCCNVGYMKHLNHQLLPKNNEGPNIKGTSYE